MPCSILLSAVLDKRRVAAWQCNNRVDLFWEALRTEGLCDDVDDDNDDSDDD